MYEGDNWFKDTKPTIALSFPNIPYIKHGNFMISEHQAVMRYVCEQFNPELLGKTLRDKGMADMTTNVIYDLIKASRGPCYMAPDEATAKKEVLEATEKLLPAIVKFLGDKKYLIGEYLTYVDFYFYEHMDYTNLVIDNHASNTHPTVKAYMERMAALPYMKKHIAARSADFKLNAGVAKLNN